MPKKTSVCENDFTDIEVDPYEYVWDDAIEYGETAGIFGSSQIADAVADYMLATAAF